MKKKKNLHRLEPNRTKNQHFIAQGVQRLNANPSESGKRRYIKAYKRVAENTIALVNDVALIEKNLSMDDLYTFDIDGRLRRNFETLFHSFENDIRDHTLSLIEKVRAHRSDIHAEVHAVLRAKFMDFVRSPYNIRHCFRIFPQLATMTPDDPMAAELHQQVLNGRKPHQDKICATLSITLEDYRNWLSTMFMLLYPIPEKDEPLLDQIRKAMVAEKRNVCGAHVVVYDKPAVLLSDRAGNFAIKSDSQLCLEFHASSDMLITLYVLPLDTTPNMIRTAPPGIVDLEPLKRLVERHPDLMPANGLSQEWFAEMVEEHVSAHDQGFEIRIEQNIDEFAAAYNRRTVNDCQEFVYGLAPEFPGIAIVDS